MFTCVAQRIGLVLSMILAAAAAAKEPARPPLSTSGDAKPLIDREIVAAKELDSLRGVNKQVWQVVTDERALNPIEYITEYALAKPNRFFMENKQFRIYADGHTLTVYHKFLKHYTVGPAPAPAELREAVEMATQRQVRAIPGELVINPDVPMDVQFKNITSFGETRRGEVGGKPGTWVSGTAFDESQPSEVPITFERWYSDEDGFVGRVMQDFAPMYQEIAERKANEDLEPDQEPKPVAKYLKVGWESDFTRELNPALSAETFIFTPGAEDKRVEEFIMPRFKLKEQVAMLGLPAPAIEGADLEGNPVSLADFKGKIVVLDFWATWCGPCCAGLPSMQMIKDKYAGDGLVLLGVNRDHTGDGPKAVRYLARKGFDIPQIDDIAGKVAEEYNVGGIPHVVIIDREGNIADVDVGYLPGKEQELMAKLDMLFSGKPLRSPEKVAQVKKQVGVAE